MKKELVLVGGGGHCKSVIEVAESAGYRIKGILDKPELVGKKVLDYFVIGTDEQIIDMVGEVLFVITVGHVKNPSPGTGSRGTVCHVDSLECTCIQVCFRGRWFCNHASCHCEC